MVSQIQPVHFLDANDHDTEILPRDGVVEIGDFLAETERWVFARAVFGDGMTWDGVSECAYFFCCQSIIQ